MLATTKGCMDGSSIGFDLINKDSKRFVGWFTYFGPDGHQDEATKENGMGGSV